MNLLFVTAAIGVFVFVGIFSAAYAIFMKALNVRERINRTQGGETAMHVWQTMADRVVHFFRPLGEMIPRSPEEMSRQERRITQAGIRRRDSALVLHGIQAATIFILLFAFALSGALRHRPFVFLALSFLLGAMIPDLILTRMIALRKERIRLGLPDALDLTVVCVEAGLGLDQSLMRVGHEIRLSHPDLSDELHVTNLEMNMGRSRAEALRNLGTRADVDDLKALCAILIQTDRFGTSIGQALRISSDSLRTKRRQRAEEKAAKLAVKTIPPLVLFIFPAMFVVIVGPAVITIIRDFLPALARK